MSIDKVNEPVGPILEEEVKPSLINLGYPIRLAQSESKVKMVGTFTANEFCTLQNIWKHIKADWHRDAKALYVDFYTENYNEIELFRSKKTKKICLKEFSEHAKMIFTFFKEVIDNGSVNWHRSKIRMINMAKAHVAHGIRLYDLTLMADAFKGLILRKCEGITSPKVIIVLDKLFEEVFEYQNKRELIGIDDASLESF